MPEDQDERVMSEIQDLYLAFATVRHCHMPSSRPAKPA